MLRIARKKCLVRPIPSMRTAYTGYLEGQNPGYTDYHLTKWMHKSQFHWPNETKPTRTERIIRQWHLSQESGTKSQDVEQYLFGSQTAATSKKDQKSYVKNKMVWANLVQSDLAPLSQNQVDKVNSLSAGNNAFCVMPKSAGDNAALFLPLLDAIMANFEGGRPLKRKPQELGFKYALIYSKIRYEWI